MNVRDMLNKVLELCEQATQRGNKVRCIWMSHDAYIEYLQMLGHGEVKESSLFGHPIEIDRSVYGFAFKVETEFNTKRTVTFVPGGITWVQKGETWNDAVKRAYAD